jgi:serine/threonine protein kinase
MADWIGKTLGKVRIDLLIARGGMAEVYLGVHTSLDRPVAVKLLRNQFQDDPDLLDRFQREARAVAMLRHPNIVQVFDFDTINSQPYLVMEYIPGVSLSTYLRSLHQNNEKLELPLVNRLLEALAGALQYAHETGVIHRDVKPGNILLNSRSSQIEINKPLPSDVQPVLTDFGLVRYLNSASQTATGQIAGTPAYMSPEQARGALTDTRTDIYSLGIVLYELLAGRVPFEADTTMGVLIQHINEPPPPIRGLDADQQAVIDRALAKKPEDRYQTPLELSNAFQAALVDHSESSTAMPLDFQNTQTMQLATPAPSASKLVRLPYLLVAGVALLIGLFLIFKPTIPVSVPTETQTHEHVSLTTEAPYTEEAAAIGVLRFQDGTARLDQVRTTALELPAPPGGQQYEAWLVEEGDEQRRSLGVLDVDASGAGTLTFVDPQGRNLLERYNQLEITIEPDPDPNPNPSDRVAYTAKLPPDGLTHVRHLLVAFGTTPENIGLVHGLLASARLVDQAALDMFADQQAGDNTAARKNAEGILNMLVGSQSPDYKDWDEDGETHDPGDGFGLLLNGDNIGYIEGTFSHADLALRAEDATENMKVHGEHVKIASGNLEEWAPALRDLMKQILSAPSDFEMEQSIREAVVLADEILLGTDLNGDEKVDPVPGEGGAETAYQHALYMADITIYLQSSE